MVRAGDFKELYEQLKDIITHCVITFNYIQALISFQQSPVNHRSDKFI